ncbi:MAG: hypothetical protein ACOCX8_03740 [Bacteroidota bacterium]
MTILTGTYFNGELKLDQEFCPEKPVKVRVIIEGEKHEDLKLSDFSFLETQQALIDYKGSFSDEVIEERRKAL